MASRLLRWDADPAMGDVVSYCCHPDCHIYIRADGSVKTEDREEIRNKQRYSAFCLNVKPFVSAWKDIVSIVASGGYAVGLKKDGSLVIAQSERPYERSCKGDYIALAHSRETFCLKRDGTICTPSGSQSDFTAGWKDIVAIASSPYHIVGLRADGTVLAQSTRRYDDSDNGECATGDWRDIVAISAAHGLTVGLRADGTVVAAGRNTFGQRNVGGWKLFGSIDTLEAEIRRQLADEEAAMARCREELAAQKGLFAMKRRKALNAQLEEGERTIRRLRFRIDAIERNVWEQKK